ncbi:hypothetical protein N0V93_009132 [Gnomoniopsis smithogilvyi]|uniref:Pre-mRNA-splicing factor 38B n=1 Tax=Gnomoniopsis smithogilvyi TaxID=1191159 RepID=A0A9W8YJ48_9PEZI|nr:hypothetical protein N0V93_009132 [Gnomoniopsis smithogilvyi]
MGNNDLLTDDAVAELLVNEAKDCSLKYSTMGMEAYTSSSSSSSRPASKFKPNTRFLRNIIKGTDRHNKALLAKEQTEAQARLKDLADAEEAKRRKYRPSAGEIRGRQLGNITALLSGSAPKRKRATPVEDGDGEVSAMQKARAAEDARRLADMAAAKQRARENRGKRRRSMERYSVRKGKDRTADEEDEYYERRNSSSEEEERRQGDRKRRRKERSRSPRSSPQKHRHRSPLRDSKKKDADEPSERSHSRRTDPTERSTKTNKTEDDADSDPLEDLIGPKPPPRVRGRGALRGASGMDSRFTPDYDPKSDVQPDDDLRDDWDESLEALRDRAKWKQQGADRLRQAGFTEDQIKKWEKGGEKTIDDVQWTKKGEGREWDRGKKSELEHEE